MLTKDDGLRKHGRFGRHKFAESESQRSPGGRRGVGLPFHLYTALASVWLDGAGSRVGSGSCRHAAPTTGERPGLRVPRGVTQGPREWDGPRVAALQAATLLCWFLTLAAVRIAGECSKTDAQHLYLIRI